MIPTALLIEIAEYVDDKVDKVVLNSGAYTINSFESRDVDSSTIELEYLIPLGSVVTATLIELKSSADQVISSNIVNIPITSDTIIKQNLIVREV